MVDNAASNLLQELETLLEKYDPTIVHCAAPLLKESIYRRRVRSPDRVPTSSQRSIGTLLNDLRSTDAVKAACLADFHSLHKGEASGASMGKLRKLAEHLGLAPPSKSRSALLWQILDNLSLRETGEILAVISSFASDKFADRSLAGWSEVILQSRKAV